VPPFVRAWGALPHACRHWRHPGWSQGRVHAGQRSLWRGAPAAGRSTPRCSRRRRSQQSLKLGPTPGPSSPPGTTAFSPPLGTSSPPTPAPGSRTPSPAPGVRKSSRPDCGPNPVCVLTGTPPLLNWWPTSCQTRPWTLGYAPSFSALWHATPRVAPPLTGDKAPGRRGCLHQTSSLGGNSFARSRFGLRPLLLFRPLALTACRLCHSACVPWHFHAAHTLAGAMGPHRQRSPLPYRGREDPPSPVPGVMFRLPRECTLSCTTCTPDFFLYRQGSAGDPRCASLPRR